jgi:arylsulfatase A-like enzyme
MKCKFSPFVLFAVFFIFISCKETKKEEQKPNFIILFTDDQGWADLGYKQEKFITPHIDKFKSEGVFFSDARPSSPACSPSRASIITGKHAVDLEIVRHIPATDTTKGFDWEGNASKTYNQWEWDPANMPSKNWLDLEEVTYAEALKKLNYYNFFIGKWHLGEKEYYPIHQGFDEQHFITNWGAPTRYYPPYFVRWEDHPQPGDSTKTYLTDSITEVTVDFIKNYNGNKPFHISLFYYNVHHPHDGKIEWVRKYRKMGYSEKEAQYAAMVSAVDESVGKIIASLKEKGIENETCILFASDQGGMFDNPPFTGGKMSKSLNEGGARIPFVLKYGNHFEPQKISNPISTYDVFPTLVDLAGGKPDNYPWLAGNSLVPLIKGNEIEFKNRPIISYRSYESQYASIRQGKWKFIAYRDGSMELFNLNKDKAEHNNLANEYPELINKYKTMLIEWEKEKDVFKYSGFNKNK